jgi:alpha-glucosidase
MPPRFAFGLWWSRYWAYTDQGLKDLVRQYETHDTPLDVLVIDMDWHETFELRWDDGEEDQAGQWKGWTGYTWNETYFPDPEAFLDWTEEQNLKVPLNLHPASGIQPWETQYEEMARAMGIDPSTREYVPFNIVDKEFTRNYFDIVIDPLEEQGVDFWWLD